MKNIFKIGYNKIIGLPETKVGKVVCGVKSGLDTIAGAVTTFVIIKSLFCKPKDETVELKELIRATVTETLNQICLEPEDAPIEREVTQYIDNPAEGRPDLDEYSDDMVDYLTDANETPAPKKKSTTKKTTSKRTTSKKKE